VYKSMGKRIFVVARGFTEIKKEFEVFLQNNGVAIKSEVIGDLTVPPDWVSSANKEPNTLSAPSVITQETKEKKWKYQKTCKMLTIELCN